MTLADGTYRINSVLADGDNSGQGWDIDSGSLANMANLQMYRDNDTSAQIFKVETSNSWTTIKNCKSGLMVDAASGGTVSGTNIWQYASNGTNAQKWSVVDTGSTVTVNGTSYPVYKILNKANTGLAIDCEAGHTDNLTNIWLYADNATDAQHWIFHRDSPLGAFPVPANVGLSTSATGESLNVLPITAPTDTAFPVWTCESGGWQFRWRSRLRTRAGAWQSWGSWQSISGSVVEWGWEDPWAVAFSTSGSGTLNHASALTVGYEIATYDARECQVEVRRFDATGHEFDRAHGGSALGTVLCAWKPTLTISSVTFSPTGIKVAYATDWTRGGNSLTVAIPSVCDSFSTDGLAASGSVEIPFSSLQSVPNEGDAITLNATFTTCDASFDYSISSTISYSSSGGITVTPTFSITDGYVLNVVHSAYSSCTVWLVSERDGRTRYIECEQSSATRHLCLPPLNIQYHLFISAKKADGSWGTWYGTPPQISCNWWVFNFESGFALLKAGVNDPPSENRTIERDSSTVLPNGSDFEITTFNHGSKRSITLDGAVIHGDTNANVSGLEALSTADYATFRTPSGWRAEVAIIEVQLTPHAKHSEATVTMKENG